MPAKRRSTRAPQGGASTRVSPSRAGEVAVIDSGSALRFDVTHGDETTRVVPGVTMYERVTTTLNNLSEPV